MGDHVGRYWSVEECAWVEYAAEPEPEVVRPADQRRPDDEPALTS